ncbi:hypothetical protein PCIT_a2423 [Pseudoalteromonas citrea]|uniref:Uncharacterized protein n=1 Tax=Pseudoalteromonas citrea TaxID=43655 RepID=A0AAD4FSL0_9GAMM|nr:hypothetical protein PCIT_a2423 [Pseudoalteromonas citrea]
MAHISGFIFALTAINFTIFSTGIIDIVALQENQLLRGTIILGIQLIFSVITMIILIFRVQLSRKLSSSNNIKLTPFDGIFYWLYIFTSIIYALGLLENVAWSYFKIASMDLIYSNIAGLIYISWALCCYMFLTMVVLSINKPRL